MSDVKKCHLHLIRKIDFFKKLLYNIYIVNNKGEKAYGGKRKCSKRTDY